jgi:hypothetical protein
VSTTRVNVGVREGALGEWTINDERPDEERNRAAVGRVLELQISLDEFDVRIGDTLNLAFSLWRDKLPIDALPEEGWIEVRVVTEQEMSKVLHGEHWSA